MSSTINEVFSRYCRAQVELTPDTLQHTLWALNLLCRFVTGSDDENPTTLVHVDRVDRDVVEDWRAWLVERVGPEGRPRYSKSSARSAMASAAPLFRWAANRETPLVAKNPFRGVQLFTVEPVVVEFTQEEIDRMLAVANLRWQGMIRVGVTAGAERSFVQNLVWDDFNLEDNLVRVCPKENDATAGTWKWHRKRRGVHGRSSSQWLPVSEHIGDVLGELRIVLHPKQPYPFVAGPRYWDLRGRIGHLSASIRNSPDQCFAAGFDRVMKMAKVPKIVGEHSRSFHDLRATFACNNLRQGMDIKTVSDLMGHASIVTTDTYYLAVNKAGCQQARANAMA